MGVVRSPPRGVPFVGRGDELGALIGFVSQARRGQLTLAAVEGEPGIGKTRLLDEAQRELERLGFMVLRASADELGRGDLLRIPLQALGLGSEKPADSTIDFPGALRFRLIQAVIGNLEDRCRSGPVALILDDLQWVDPATLLLLRSLPDRMAGFPLAVIYAYRPLVAGR